MDKYKFHISPIAETYCYCLMPNHFHFLIRIKSEAEVLKAISKRDAARSVPANVSGFGSNSEDANVPGFQNLGRYAGWPTEKILSKQLSNFFNSYAKAFNKQYNRMGSLFIKNFKRKKVEDMRYMKNLIEYIHNNPVRKGYVEQPQQWRYSSARNYENMKGMIEVKTDW